MAADLLKNQIEVLRLIKVYSDNLLVRIGSKRTKALNEAKGAYQTLERLHGIAYNVATGLLLYVNPEEKEEYQKQIIEKERDARISLGNLETEILIVKEQAEYRAKMELSRQIKKDNVITGSILSRL